MTTGRINQVAIFNSCKFQVQFGTFVRLFPIHKLQDK